VGVLRWLLKPRWARVLAAALVVLALAMGMHVTWYTGTDAASQVPVAVVRRGPLTISVTTSGTVQSRERVVLKSEVEGVTTILSLAEEGTHVRQGDLLVELDSSNLQDQKNQQLIVVLNAEAGFIRARENLAVTQSQTESDIAQAGLASKFAELDLKKYLEGEYPRELQKAESDITIAREELQRAHEKLEWSKKLAAEGYVTRTELQADELATKRAEIDLKLARSDLELLEKYTHQRDLEQLRSDADQAKKAFERTQRKAAADLVQAEAELKAKESEYERQKARLAKIEAQIAKCRITASVDGMVVYATTEQFSWRGNIEPLAEGQQVRERQELISLPTTSAMTAKVKVHESSLRKVRKGMPVRVTINALPGEVFWGRVTKIAVLADALSVWLNPDLKVYTTHIDLEGDTSVLRPGMSCRAEIIVQEYADALYVPVQAVARVEEETVVYVRAAGRLERRAVKVGLDNNRVIHIMEGLEEGETVSLAPPLAASAVPADDGPQAPAGSRPAATTTPAAARPARSERPRKPEGRGRD